jgi:ABC-type nitrate/sulfonate/bicarbonate transport system permease component
MKKHIVIGPVLLLIIWIIISELELINSFLFPGPIPVSIAFWELLREQSILPDTAATLIRTLSAFFLSALLGIPLGIWLGQSRPLYESMEFVIDLFRSTPSAALFPLFLLLFGIGDSSKIAVATFASVLIIIFNTAYGVMNTSPTRSLAATLMGATTMQRLRYVLLWESLPQTFIGLRNAISLALVLIVVTEMFIGTTYGLGHRIIAAQISYEIPEMYTIILATGLLGYTLNMSFNFIENRYVHWKYT